MTERRQPVGDDRARALKLASVRTLLVYLGMGLLLIAVLVVLGDEIAHHLRAIDAWIVSLGLWGVLAFVGLFVVATSVFVPETVLSIMAGALFGMAEGLLTVVAAGLAAATAQFVLSRWVLRSRIERTLTAKPSLAALQHAVLLSEFRLQVMIRLTPLNPATLNYLLGAAGVRLRGFLLASLAFLPHQVVEVYFGHAGRHVTKITGRIGSAVYLQDALVLGGLIMCIIVLALITRTARRAVAVALAEAVEPRLSESRS
jgi:uncharacterized membrane protein YdjX (TVP38/TMEM64 family)